METPRRIYAGILGLSFLCLLHHIFLWGRVVDRYDLEWVRLLQHWDSAWYNRIINFGYFGKSWAFFPLYPMMVKCIHSFLESIPPQITGAIFSTILFLSFSLIVAYLMTKSEKNELLPKNILSWFFFVYSASSFVFHSHHTESLFVLLSFLAFWTALEERWVLAGIFAGLSWLTRHQGAFVSFCVALQCASSFYQNAQYKKSFLRAASTFFISASLFALYPLYQYLETGSASLFIRAQTYWQYATGFESILKTLWFANPLQRRLSLLQNLLHHIYYIFLWCLVFMLWKRNRILAIYGALSLAVLFLQASFLNIFRFGVVLFPLHFLLGEKISSQNLYVKASFVLLVVLLNHYVTSNYAIGNWAY